MSSPVIEVVVGVIGRPHGIRGEVAVEPRTDEPDRRFAPGQVLRAERGRARFTVRSARQHSGRLLVGFDELADRTAAERARGTVLVADVSAEERPGHREEYFDRQLIGLRVVDRTGAERGRVAGVEHPGAQDLLRIDTPTGTRLVPFVADLVPDVDLAAATLTVADLPGLLDDAAEVAGPGAEPPR